MITSEDSERVSETVVWQIRDGREVFRRTVGTSFIETATLSENGESLVVMLGAKRKGYGHGETYRFWLVIHDLTGRCRERKLPEMEIPVGRIRVTVNDAGTAASVWADQSQHRVRWCAS